MCRNRGNACGVVQQSIYVRCTEWLYEAANVRHSMVAFTAAGIAWLCYRLAVAQRIYACDAIGGFLGEVGAKRWWFVRWMPVLSIEQ
jgi:hypothetical protein